MRTTHNAMVVWLAALLSLGGLACGDDDGEVADAGFDAGSDEDAGGDDDAGGEEDAGCDPMCDGRECGDDGCGGVCGGGDGTCPGGLECDADGRCPDTVFTRISHLIPNAPNVDICLYVDAGGEVSAPTGPLFELNEVPAGMPFRGVSGYVGLVNAVPGVTYIVKVFNETDVAGADSCPANDEETPAPILEDNIAGGDLTAGAFYTIAAVGFADAEGGGDPTFCGAPPAFGVACSADNQQAHLEVYEDTVTVSTAGQTSMRFLHTVPNLGTLDVCHDPDGDAGAMEPVELFANVEYLGADPMYLERDPITAGHISLHINIDGMTCPNIDVGGGIMSRIAVVPVPWPDPVGTAALPGSVKTFEADQVATIMLSGNAATPAEAATAVSAIPWADAPPASP